MRLRSREQDPALPPRDPVMPGDKPAPARPLGRILLDLKAISPTAYAQMVTDQQRSVQPASPPPPGTTPAADAPLRRGDGRIEPLVVAAYEPNDRLSRAVRKLRVAISAARRDDGRAIRAFAILGIDTEAEAALLAANMAVAFAQAGDRTLLVDANFVRPVHDRLFHLPNQGGVAQVMAGNPAAAIQPSAVSGLSIVTTGPAGGDHSALFARLRPCADRFDMILVDAGSTDAAALAACSGADGVVLALRGGVTSLKTVRAISDGLAARGTPVLGSIIVR